MSVGEGHANSSYVPPSVSQDSHLPNNLPSEIISNYEGFDELMRCLLHNHTNRAYSILCRGEIYIYQNNSELLQYLRGRHPWSGNLNRLDIRRLYNVLINSYSYKINKNDPLYIQENQIIPESVSDGLTVDNRITLLNRNAISEVNTTINISPIVNIIPPSNPSSIMHLIPSEEREGPVEIGGLFGSDSD